MSMEKIADKIKKLLALSTSSNEAEASSALEKAHKLLADHSLSMGDITLEEQTILEEEIFSDITNLHYWKKVLASTLARLNFCELLVRKAIHPRS